MRLEDAGSRSGIFRKPVGRANRPPHELACAIRATALEHAVGACCAERAFERADEGRAGIWRQIAVAAFAIRAQFKHGKSLSKPRPGRIELRPVFLHLARIVAFADAAIEIVLVQALQLGSIERHAEARPIRRLERTIHEPQLAA